MLEKLIWISAFMLVGARHPGATVGAVEKDYRSEVRILSSHMTTNFLQLCLFSSMQKVFLGLYVQIPNL